MSDTSLNKVIQYGTAAARAAFTPSPASGSQVLYLWYETDNPPNVYAWDGSAWAQLNPAATIANNAVTDAKLRDSAALTVIGRSANSSGDPADIAGATVGQVLQVAAGPILAFGQQGLTLIEAQTPSGVGTITFSSLGAFTHLELRYVARGTTAAAEVGINLTFNGDTGANYDTNFLIVSDNVADFGAFGSSSAPIGNMPGSTATANCAGSGTVAIYDYRGTTFQKTGMSITQLRGGSTQLTQVLVQSAIGWRSTAAITSLTLTAASGNYVAGSKFTLYGLR